MIVFMMYVGKVFWPRKLIPYRTGRTDEIQLLWLVMDTG